MADSDFSSDSSDMGEIQIPDGQHDPSVNVIFSIFQAVSDHSSDDTSSSNSDSCPDEEEPALDEHTRSLPSEHQYLGELEPLHGRVMMDDGSIQKLPAIHLNVSFYLVPGQTFPLLIRENSVISALKYAVEHDHIFCIVSAVVWSTLHNKRDAPEIGTTAEIIAFGQTEDGLRIKAIGRQRFKTIEVKDELIDGHKVLFAHVQIMPEITLSHVLYDHQLNSLNRIRSRQRLKCLRREACQSPWPLWTYQMYDDERLVKDMKKKLILDFRMSRNIKYSDDATTLFFQVLKNIPMTTKLMQEGMTLNNSTQRLNWLKQQLQLRSNRLVCVSCRAAVIGKSSDIFPMSAEGPHGTYTNNIGWVLELITLRKAKHVDSSGTPTTDHTWFPNYAWQYLFCSRCNVDLGWKFIACEKHLNPPFFYAVRIDSVRVTKAEKEKQTGRSGSRWSSR